MSWKSDAPIKFHVSGIDFYGYYVYSEIRQLMEVTFFSHDPVSKLVRHRLDIIVTEEELEEFGSVEKIFENSEYQQYIFCMLASEIVYPIRHQRDDGFRNLWIEDEAKTIIIDWLQNLKWENR